MHMERSKLATITNLSLADEEFVYNVGCDIESYLKQRHQNGVLLFPPVNNFRRFLIHQTCENFRHQYDLFTFSVGQGPFRRTVVCFKHQLLDPYKYTDNAVATSFEKRKQSPIKNWRTDRRIDSTSLYETSTQSTAAAAASLSLASYSSNLTKRDKNLNAKMGVEKHSNEPRLHKTNSLDLYRPPALRNQHSIETADVKANAISTTATIAPAAATAIEDIKTMQSVSSSTFTNTTTTTSLSCNNSPIRINENVNYENSVTSSNSNSAGLATATTAAATTTLPAATQVPAETETETTCVSNAVKQQRQQTAARRERRPDRAVYIPRARRSQTTPPTTAAATLLTSNNQHSPTDSEANTTALVSSATSYKTDDTTGRSASHRKSKSHNTATNTGTTGSTGTGSNSSSCSSGCSNKERKERLNKKSNQTSALAATAKISKFTDKPECNASDEVINSQITNHLNCDSVLQREPLTAKIDSHESTIAALIPLATTATTISPTTNTERLSIKESKSTEHKEEFQEKNLDYISAQVIVDINNMNSANINNNSNINTSTSTINTNTVIMSSTTNSPSNATATVAKQNLRIEDAAVVTNGSKRNPTKCDIDDQELQRASKEINRSNRRIMKQTFVSDVLEIPEKIDHKNGKTKTATSNLSSSAFNTAVDSNTEEEEEDDDWETMFDESGECLDPKIMQELAASVGKVKIELPKMDYSAYLTKQSILNDEEFPHVLEVSNFPVEFKNQDLLMVFSQYKESGFDIKWVDDTHALAVFSSSRIAAEVLTMGHPFVVLKPLAEATVESRLKAKKCAASLQPYRPRPETCAALARRLVTGALGVRLKTAAAEREIEKRVLREAKERKLLAAKQRDEIWDS